MVLKWRYSFCDTAADAVVDAVAASVVVAAAAVADAAATADAAAVVVDAVAAAAIAVSVAAVAVAAVAFDGDAAASVDAGASVDGVAVAAAVAAVIVDVVVAAVAAAAVAAAVEAAEVAAVEIGVAAAADEMVVLDQPKSFRPPAPQRSPDLGWSILWEQCTGLSAQNPGLDQMPLLPLLPPLLQLPWDWSRCPTGHSDWLEVTEPARYFGLGTWLGQGCGWGQWGY